MAAGKFLDEKSIEKNRKERREEMEERKRREDARKAWAWVGLVFASTGLVALLLYGLVDLRVGAAALAVVSATLGRATK